MVPENRKKRLLDAYGIALAKRVWKAASAKGEAAGACELAAPGAAEPDAAASTGPAAPGSPAASTGLASAATPTAVVPLPLQARELGAPEEPRAHTTCKRCAATVAADATECWNCGLRWPSR